MDEVDCKELPADSYFDSDDVLRYADGRPVEDGVYRIGSGDLVIVEGNSGDIFLPE